MCEDQFSAQLYVVPKSTNAEESAKELITDGQETEGEHHHDLIVSEMSLTGEKFDVVKKDEIFMKCFGAQFRQRKPYNSGEFYVSYGFQYGRWFVSTSLEEHDINMEHIILGYNLEASPQHVPMDQIQLEHQYWVTRRMMRM